MSELNHSIKYKKLPGIGRPSFSFLGSHYRLYYHDDHLLYVHFTMGSETYRRLYFNEIDAIQISETSTYLNVTAITAVIMLIGGITTLLAAVGNGSGAVFVGILLLVLPGWALVDNLVRGKTCRTYAHTRIQKLEIQSMSRLRNARKIMNIIEPMILAAQAGASSSQSPPGAYQRTLDPPKFPTHKKDGSPYIPSNMAELERRWLDNEEGTKVEFERKFLSKDADTRPDMNPD